VKKATRRATKRRAASSQARRAAHRPARKLRLRCILIPVDFSRQSVKAVRYALSLAAKFHAEVRLLHVVDPAQEPSPAIIQMPLVTQPETIARIAKKLLQSWAVKFRIPVSAKTCSVQYGKTFKKIIEASNDARADLIVLATHGYKGLQHLIHGSTAERVVEQSRCPVLIVRKREHEFLDPEDAGRGKRERIAIRKILVPVDFSKNSLAGLKYAVLLAERFHATLRLLHTIHPYAETIGGERIPGETISLMDAVKKITRRQMRHLTQSAVLRGVRWKAEIKIGSPVDEICSESREDGIDLIVLSTGGYDGFRHLFLGNVTEQAVRCATRPVIVVPNLFKPNKK
jgi:universal stress protein A